MRLFTCRCGLLEKDDDVLMVNETMLKGLTLEESLKHLRCTDRVVSLVVARQRQVAVTLHWVWLINNNNLFLFYENQLMHITEFSGG